MNWMTYFLFPDVQTNMSKPNKVVLNCIDDRSQNLMICTDEIMTCFVVIKRNAQLMYIIAFCAII